MGSVSGQAGVQTGCAAGAEVAANVGSADQQHLRLVLLSLIHISRTASSISWLTKAI